MAVDSKVVVRREANRNAGLNERRASVKQDWICVVQMLAEGLLVQVVQRLNR